MTEIASRNRFVTGARAADDETPPAMAIPLKRREEATAVTAPAPIPAPAPVALQPVETPPADAEVLETGRALALTDFTPPDTTIGERLVRFAYRLGISGPTLAAPFRKPAKPRLLATVQSPLKGNAVAGTALRAGHFLVYGVKSPITQVDFSPAAPHVPPLERTIHAFTWLRDLEACAPRQQCTATAERVLGAWLDANGKPGKGAAWRVGHAGSRLLAWFAHAPLILGGNDKTLRSRVLASMEETARWLDRNASKADDKADELAAWCAIVAAGLLLPDGKPRRLFGEAGLARAMGEMVGADGGVLSRSPLAQMEAIARLTELAACYRATRCDPPQAVETMLQMLVPPLLSLTHGDGSLGCWQGSGAVSAETVAALVAASGVRTRPLRDSRQWGYQRVVAGKSVLQFDAAPPPLPRHAQHGCASTLAFELSHGAHRLVVNCGGSAFAGGQVPVRIEQGLRGTAAHSTLVLNDTNSTAVVVAGKLGSGVAEVEVDRRTMTAEKGASATRIEASHDGYVARVGLVHRRILILRDDGTELRGEDLLVPAGRKGKRGKVPYALRFHLGPMVEVTAGENGRGATLALPDGSYWQFVTSEGSLEVDESLWVDGDGRPHPVQQLVMQGMVSRGGGNFSWLLKKIRA
ncbi:heparinase II/III domain-containing protein [Altererythrobacter sp. Root672]|uniref:heparinase II/III family protein n=1 Tax=Altererythrobacter sp. Root672 TaxID=1736584 RepID=UPI0006F78F0C|nr:heparinase II/III family protein [Altererythrobacter sp. Root672]KRA80315.1 heparinase [Altererythrobacter sp. Root672]